jgi:hypothetical protein
MNKNTKNLIISAFVLGLGILLILIGNSLASTDTTILKNQVVDNLSFENATLEYTNNVSTFKVEVTNDNADTYNLKYIEINFKDSSDKVSKLIGYIGEVIASGETRKITASIDKDITDSVSLEYSIIK